MANPDPKNLGYRVTTRNINWLDQVVKAWGDEWAAPDRDIYKFSNDRCFDSTDQGTTGFYKKT